jgi:hypothetical protein
LQQKVGDCDTQEADRNGGPIEGDKVGLECKKGKGIYVNIVTQVPHCILFPQHFDLKLDEDEYNDNREIDEDDGEGVDSHHSGVFGATGLQVTVSCEVYKGNHKVFGHLD